MDYSANSYKLSYLRDPDNYSTSVLQYYLNVPLAWGDIWVFDAYINDQMNQRTKLEFIGTNLSDQFYIDR